MMNILGGSQTILMIQRLQMKKYGEEASTNEASNPKDPNNQIIKDDIMIKSKGYSK